MERRLPNWLDAYQEYTCETESSPIFNKWVGISTVASALRKKAWLELGRLKVFPNMYIVLVANPGAARKSQAIAYAADLVSQVPSILVSADSITPQALMEDIADATRFDLLPDGSALRHASLSVVSKEFESFLGSTGTSTKMLVTLTDLFDAGENPWKHRTKNSGTTTIPSVFLNILAATTPQSLDSCLSSLAIGGGLTSRIIFVHSGIKIKRVAVPELTPRVVELKNLLIEDLSTIASISGNFNFDEDCLHEWATWYSHYDETANTRLQPRTEFDGWYSRKPMMLQKLMVILSSCESDRRIIQYEHFKTAMEYMEEVERSMGEIFPKAFIKPVNTYYTELILRYVRQYKQISEKHLLQLIWRDIKEDEFDEYMDIILKKGDCTRQFVSPDGKEEIWYILKED